MAPGIVGIGTTSYISAHNQILAHARAYRLYQEKYLSSQGGQVGVTLNIHWAEPEDPQDPTHLGTHWTSLTTFVKTFDCFVQRLQTESYSLPWAGSPSRSS